MDALLWVFVVWVSMLFVLFCLFFFLVIRRPPRSTRTDTLFPYTTLFRSNHTQRTFSCIIIDFNTPVLHIARQGDPARERIADGPGEFGLDRKSTRLNSSH